MMPSTLLKSHNDPKRIISEAVMIHKNSKRHTVIVEGPADLRFFSQWLNGDAATIKPVQGKSKVKDIWQAAKNNKCLPIFFFADLDYDLLLEDKPVNDERFLYISCNYYENQFCADCNDLESSLIKSAALYKFLSQRLPFAVVSDYDAFAEKVNLIRENLRIAAAIIGSYRAANQEHFSRHKNSLIGSFKITDDFMDYKNIAVDKTELLNLLLRSCGSSQTIAERVFAKANYYLQLHQNDWSLCRGHDLCHILAEYLTATLNRRVVIDEVETGLREAFELSMMDGIGFWTSLRSLQSRINSQLFRV